jgi:hypothetical protein
MCATTIRPTARGGLLLRILLRSATTSGSSDVRESTRTMKGKGILASTKRSIRVPLVYAKAGCLVCLWALTFFSPTAYAQPKEPSFNCGTSNTGTRGFGYDRIIVRVSNFTDQYFSCNVRCEYRREKDLSKLTHQCDGVILPGKHYTPTSNVFCARGLQLADGIATMHPSGAVRKKCTPIPPPWETSTGSKSG